ncbi:putative bifunctional diguanylate cyclase/phosphodiesterase [Trinickia acidisoli]|uniref:putative bifunctional diguanylate cyclase/phosphodiesterase n=1 Tax=Trinickia acidisoli TaxID=2767482 RepID=UPI001A8FFBFA|nr:EAL domain-containing protein [Trinickia acidisoli]
MTAATIANRADAPRQGAKFVRRIYVLRLFGFGLGFLPVLLLLRSQHAHPLTIAAVAAVCFLWPHLAFMQVRAAPQPLLRERWNFMIDSINGGWFIAAVHFSPIATVVVFLMFAIDNMAAGGWRLFGYGLLVMALGLGAGVLIFGTQVVHGIDPHTALAWVPVLIGYPLVLAKTTYDVYMKLTERSRRLRELSERDSLTGLPNRVTIAAKLQAMMTRAARIHVLFIDLDAFKTVNDALGHTIGDQLLVEVAARLAACAGRDDLVARYGGDEFIIVSELRDGDARQALGDAVLTALAEPIVVAGHELFAGASIGISVFPEDGGDAEGLIRAADMAMYAAKGRGRNCCEFYRHRMRSDADARLKLSGRLRKAIEGGKLHLNYQPQVDMRTGEVRGLEALVRWRDEAHGIVSPVDFVAIAEASGLVSQLGEWVLRAVCEQAATWRDLQAKPIPISVNVSPLQLQRADIVATFQRVVKETGMDPSLLELEVTETALMKNPEASARRLAEFRRLGMRVAIDDFGMGYSSLGQLRALPVDRIKIDRAFVRGIGAGDSGAIATAVVTLANAFGLDVIAEGVETQAQRAFLIGLGCVEAQGFLFSKPLDADAATRLLLQGALLPLTPSIERGGQHRGVATA